jgi:hypothetical protein
LHSRIIADQGASFLNLLVDVHDIQLFASIFSYIGHSNNLIVMKFDIDGVWEGVYSYVFQNYLEMEIGRIGEAKSFFRKIPIEEALKKLPIEKMPPDQVPFSLTVKKRWFINI